MAQLEDPEILARFLSALANWRFTGYVEFKPVAGEWVRTNLPRVRLREIAEAMYNHLKDDGVIDQVRETRPEWSEFQYHYDFRLRLAEKLLYIETVLNEDRRNDPSVHVVSIHDA